MPKKKEDAAVRLIPFFFDYNVALLAASVADFTACRCLSGLFQFRCFLAFQCSGRFFGLAFDIAFFGKFMLGVLKAA